MCGILGIVNLNIKKDILIKMRDLMAHRGPDDSGLWINKDATVGLAHTRLSILDLSEAGRQPMSDLEEKVWITFNGEIYNFQEIRDDLKKKGYIFRTRTDTEVIINAYKEWGTECVKKFNGMFAFGIYDDINKILFLARDRVGKKPLYYYFSGNNFVFASELKSIYLDKSIPREIDFNAANYYLTFGYIGGEFTIYKKIKKLLPGHALLLDIKNKKLNFWKYWNIRSLAQYNNNIVSEEELLEEFQELFEDAVKIRMISDVPLGAFLSGGVDSSLVVAMMSKISNVPVKTFSIGFDEKKYNELPYADIVAEHFETNHHRFIVKPDAFEILPKLVRQFDEPFADSSMIPTYYVSKVTRDHVTVVLSGDGGDEVFAGYTQYLGTLGNYYACKFLPSFLRKVISKFAEFLPEKVKGKRQLMRLKYEPYRAYIDRISNAYFKINYRSKIFNNEIIKELNEKFESPEYSRLEFFDYFQNDLVNALSFSDYKTYLPDDILVKVDRTSMFVSLEVRAPLLDYRIAEFSFTKIPGSLKLKKFILKYFLKKLAKKYLPEELNINRKQGFAVPVSEWFRGTLRKQVEDILLGNKIEFFNREFIIKLLKEHNNGINHSGRLFILLVFCLWWREVYEKN